MSNTVKITCPGCSAAMNHHAVKVEYDPEEPWDPVFEGVVLNVHTCPSCGKVEMIAAD